MSDCNRIVLEEQRTNKLPHSNCTANLRISVVREHILEQTVAEMKVRPYFVFQLHKTADFSHLLSVHDARIYTSVMGTVMKLQFHKR